MDRARIDACRQMIGKLRITNKDDLLELCDIAESADQSELTELRAEVERLRARNAELEGGSADDQPESF